MIGFGTQYYRPPFPETRFWRDDLARMRDAGLNTVQLWILWGWVEPEPGTFRFEDYDTLVNAADDVLDIGNSDGINAGEGFIEHDKRRMSNERSRYLEASAFTA